MSTEVELEDLKENLDSIEEQFGAILSDESSNIDYMGYAMELLGIVDQINSVQKMLHHIYDFVRDSENDLEDCQNTDNNVRNWTIMEFCEVMNSIKTALLTFKNLEGNIKPTTLLHDNFKAMHEEIGLNPVNFIALHKFRADIQKIKPRVENIVFSLV